MSQFHLFPSPQTQRFLPQDLLRSTMLGSAILVRTARRTSTSSLRRFGTFNSASKSHSGGEAVSAGAVQGSLRNDVREMSEKVQGEGKSQNGSNPAMSFPCLDVNESRSARILSARLTTASTTPISTIRNGLSNLPIVQEDATTDPEGPEPAYANIVTGYSLYRHSAPFKLDYGGHLPEFALAYESWGEMNADKSNVVLIHTGLSASSHAKSTPRNTSEGWWEKFIGPGLSIDTDKYFVICTNVLGGCYGSTGPSSLDPSDGKPYATRFPVLSIFDMVRAQFHLLDYLGVDKLFASVGSSMGGMQSIAAGHLEPERVGKVVSISGTARSSPASIAMRHAQRSGASCRHLCSSSTDSLCTVLMADPNWKRGFYYDDMPPHTGMKLARRASLHFAVYRSS